MKGTCEKCLKQNSCSYPTGALFGFCSVYYEPKEREFYKTLDGWHGAQILDNDGRYLVFAIQYDEDGRSEYWFTVGKGYKTYPRAVKAAAAALAKFGYVLKTEAKI